MTKLIKYCCKKTAQAFLLTAIIIIILFVLLLMMPNNNTNWNSAKLKDFTNEGGYAPLNLEILRQTNKQAKHINTSLSPSRKRDDESIYGISQYSIDGEYRTICFKAESSGVTIVNMQKTQEFMFCGFE